MPRALLFVPFIALMACAAPDAGNVRIVGHGGLGADGAYPMNSREALLGGLSLGIAGVEMDVQLTADSVLVAYHDQDLGERTGCTGLINSKTWAELNQCPNTGHAGSPYPLVRLDSLLLNAATDHPAADFTLDCKLFAAGDWWDYLRAFAQVLKELNAQPALHGKLLVECQTDDFLRLLNEQPDMRTFLYATDLPGDLDRAMQLGCAGITVDNAMITGAQVQLAHGLGLQVAVFGVGSAWGHRKAFGKGPDRLQTDAPGTFDRP